MGCDVLLPFFSIVVRHVVVMRLNLRVNTNTMRAVPCVPVRVTISEQHNASKVCQKRCGI